MGLRDDAAEVAKIGGPHDWFGRNEMARTVTMSVDVYDSLMTAHLRMATMIGEARAHLMMAHCLDRDCTRALSALCPKETCVDV